MREIGIFEKEILEAIQSIPDGTAYGSSIRDSIQATSGRSMASSGATHTTLVRMEDKGWITSDWSVPTAERGGRRKRIYRLTKLGATLISKKTLTEANLETIRNEIKASVAAMTLPDRVKPAEVGMDPNFAEKILNPNGYAIPRKPVVKVHVATTMESEPKGKGYWVTLTNAAGQTITPHMYYIMDRALIDAQEWADFFGLPVTPFFEDGVEQKPSMTLGKYETDEIDRWT